MFLYCFWPHFGHTRLVYSKFVFMRGLAHSLIFFSYRPMVQQRRFLKSFPPPRREGQYDFAYSMCCPFSYYYFREKIDLECFEFSHFSRTVSTVQILSPHWKWWPGSFFCLSLFFVQQLTNFHYNHKNQCYLKLIFLSLSHSFSLVMMLRKFRWDWQPVLSMNLYFVYKKEFWEIQ